MDNANLIIDELGGTGAVAELCDVTTGAVSQWRNDGIPRARLMFLKVKRPGVFRRLAVAAGDTPSKDTRK